MSELEQINPWNDPAVVLPKPRERCIIYLQGWGSNNRPQFATFHSGGYFQNASCTKFKPEFVNWWMSVSALPPVPKEPMSVYMKAKYEFTAPPEK